MLEEILNLVKRIGLLEKSIESLNSVGATTIDLRIQIKQCRLELEKKKRQFEKKFILAKDIPEVLTE